MKRFLTTDDLDPTDLRLVAQTPDAGFSPQRNAANIKKAIDSGIEIELLLRKAQQKDMMDKVDILSSFARNSIGKGHTQNLEKYVGRHRMGQIYGEKILEKVKIMESVQRLNKSNGNTLMGGKFFLT